MSYQKALWKIENAKNQEEIRLDLSDLNLDHIPQELSQLTQLRELWLYNNQIREIKGLERLRKLEKLILHTNQIGEIKGLEQLSQLQKLDLSRNQIREVKGLGGLKQLQELKLYKNRISEIKGLEQLELMTLLRLDGNQISEITGLSQLKSLRSLRLDMNQISEIKGLEQLKSLRSLRLDMNQISEIRGLESLTDLSSLNLNSNRINDIQGLKNLKGIEEILLMGNQISVIPPYLLELNLDIVFTSDYIYDRKIFVYRNPITKPPAEIVEQGNAAIHRYWEQIKEEGKDYLYEAKLILVGDGGVGKTTLLNQLRGNPGAQTSRTRGVEIDHHNFTNRTGQSFDLNIWDFGGQDIYYAVHRFFLTENSLYLLLTNTRSPEDNFDYWIPNIALFGGKSPIITIKNKWEGFQRDISIKRFVQEEAFYVINQIFEANLLKGDGFDKIQKAIYHHTQDLPHIGQTVPKTWIKVRNALKELDSGSPYISFDKFEAVCHEKSIKDSHRIRDLARYFHDLGIALWYHQIPQLAGKVILQPEWVTDAVYKVIDDQKVQDSKGHFDISDLQRLWKDESYKEMHGELVELMKAFRLCYQKRGKDQFIIPALLIHDENTTYWKPGPCLQVEYEYQFLPKGIVNQLTAELHQEIKVEDSVWSRGVILETDLAEARVVEDWYKRKVTIEVKGKAARGLLQIIMRELDVINETYAGIKVSKWVPCICDYCQEAEEVNRFKYDRLIQKLKRGKENHYCDADDDPVPLNDLLLNVGYKYNRMWQNTTDATIPNVFFSFADEDEEIRAEIEKYLIQLKRRKEIVIWTSREVLPGQTRSKETVKALENADIVIQLLSADYINSQEIMTEECPSILDLLSRGEVRLIPIYVRPCLWDSAIPKDLKILPRNRKALSTFNDRDEILVKIAREVLAVINVVRGKKSA